MTSSSDTMIQYARRGRGHHYDPKGRVVHINDVISGKNCECFCIECGTQMVARKGVQNRKGSRRWSFAHLPQSFSSSSTSHDGVVRACATTGESLLHRLAKEILASEQKMVIKAIYATSKLDRSFNGKTVHRQLTKFINFLEPFETFDRVELEQSHQLDDGSIIRPDATVYKNGQIFCCVEFFVTHRVDATKKQKFEQLGLPCLEIDISNGTSAIEKNEKGVEVFRPAWTLDEIRKNITTIAGKSRQTWIFHPDQHNLFVRTRQENSDLFAKELHQRELDYLRDQQSYREREADYLKGSDRPAIQAFLAGLNDRRRECQALDPEWTRRTVKTIYDQRGSITLNVFPGTLQFSSSASRDDYDFIFSPEVTDQVVNEIVDLWEQHGIFVAIERFQNGVLGKMALQHHNNACHLMVEKYRKNYPSIHLSQIKTIILDFDSRYAIFDDPLPSIVSDQPSPSKKVFPFRR